MPSKVTEHQNFKNLKVALEKFTVATDQIYRRRRVWKDDIKDRLYNVLRNIRLHSGMKFEIKKNESIDNLNSISFGFSNKISGISTVEVNPFTEVETTKHYDKNEGYLMFSQTYSGKILIVINYPFVHGFIEESDPEILKIVEPGNLDIGTILDVVTEYVEKMVTWEAD